MLLYKKSYTNNLTQRENKYATGEDNGIYFLESIILKNVEERNKKTKQNQTKQKSKKKKSSSPGLNKHECHDET